jgi:hypothetical protein
MKFAPNHLYIEEYIKCTNCGVLIYDERGKDKSQTIVADGKTYCSQWCLDWEHARDGSATADGRAVDRLDANLSKREL